MNNNEPVQLRLFDSNQSLLSSVVQKENPLLYFVLKHWKILLITFLVFLVAATGFGGWKYNKYMSQKITNLENLNKQYKNQVDNLQQNIIKLQSDIKIAAIQREEFDNKIKQLRTETDSLRRRINGIGTVVSSGSTPEDAQNTLNQLRADIKNKWESIGSGDQKK